MILDLQAAYQTLGLPNGTALKFVLVRYRQLVKVFHPDRFDTAEEKAFAEGELKKINNAREVIEKHWQTVVLPERAKACDTSNGAARSPESPTATPTPTPSSSPTPDPSAKTSVWQALVVAWNTEIEPTLKKWDKRLAVDDALDDYDNPLRLTHDTRKRRLWLGIALIIIIDIFCTWLHSGKNATENGDATAANSRSSSRLTAVEDREKRGQNQLDEQLNLAKQEHDRYFLRLQLDRCQLAIRQDIFISDQIELKLKTMALALPERLRLEEMKLFHERDRAVQEMQKNAIMTQLMQIGST